jgi:hypothetical protein
MPLRKYPGNTPHLQRIIDASYELEEAGFYTLANRVFEAAEELKWWREQYEQSRKAKADKR